MAKRDGEIETLIPPPRRMFETGILDLLHNLRLLPRSVQNSSVVGTVEHCDEEARRAFVGVSRSSVHRIRLQKDL